MLDPESSGSDVSVTAGDDIRFGSPLSTPTPLPPPPSKHAMESQDAVQARIRELQRVDDHNLKKHDLLKAKRSRKDDQIRRRREVEDRRIKALMDARARKDEKIAARRKREDAAFERFDLDLEEEEMASSRSEYDPSVTF